MSEARPAIAQIPFVLGVTGHVALWGLARDHRESVRQRIREQVFGVLSGDAACDWRVGVEGADALHPGYRIGTTPLILLTCLANGADRLFTEVALEEAARLGIDLTVVPLLPMPVFEYGKKFTDDPSYGVAGLQSLVTRCSDPIVMPDLPASVHDLTSDEQRDRLRYLLASITMVRWSRLIVALWDGEEIVGAPAARIGSTAHVVAMARTGSTQDPALLAIAKSVEEEAGLVQVAPGRFDLCEPLPVLHIRVGSGGRTPGDLRVKWSAPVEFESSDSFDRHYGEQLASLLQFNRDAASLPFAAAGQARRGRDLVAKLPEWLECAHRTYLAADALATRLQASRRRVMQAMYWATGLSAAGFLGYAHFVAGHQGPHWSLLVYLLALALAERWYRGAQSQRLEDRYWDSRTLAEALRVHVYLRMVGVHRPVSAQYQQHHAGSLGGIAWAIDAVIVRTAAGRGGSAPDPPSIPAELISNWVCGQLVYYRWRGRERMLRLVGSEAWFGCLVLFSLLATAVAGLWPAHHAADGGSAGHGWPWAGIVLGVVVGLAALKQMRGMRRQLAHAHVGFVAAVWSFGRHCRWWPLAVLIVLLTTLAAIGCFKTDAHTWLVVAIEVPILIAGLVHARTNMEAWGAEGVRFDRMARVFRRAGEYLIALARGSHVIVDAAMPRARDADAEAMYRQQIESQFDVDVAAGPAARERLAALGNEAVTEHVEWMLLHRERPLDLPRH